ncbi:MAG TPA: HDOD domain-containing protein [Dissulfurispiraceae bacterium]|nr:HDOD domain-containing protein [Dissulfurispiraceae bacterium]
MKTANAVRQSGNDREVLDIPSLTSVALRALQIISNKHSLTEELKNVISLDPSFTSRLLRIANSPYYRRSNSISTVDDAIMLIGQNAVKSLVVFAALKDIHQESNAVSSLLWEHSVGVAVAAMLICEKTHVLDPDEPLVQSLLHDIGKIVLNRTWSKKYARVAEMVTETALDFLEAENQTFGFNHCDVGERVAECWHLPEHISFVINHHHAERPLEIKDERAKRVMIVLRMAHQLCTMNRIGVGVRISLTDGELRFLSLDSGAVELLASRLSLKYPLYKAFLSG